MEAAAIVVELKSPAGLADPYPVYARAQALGPAAAIAPDWVIVMGYEAVNDVLTEPGFGVADANLRAGWGARFARGTAAEMISRSVLESNPPDHDRMRTTILSGLTKRYVKSLGPAISSRAAELLDAMAQAALDGPVDFMASFADPLPVIVICDLLGIPSADRDYLRQLVAQVSTLLDFATDRHGLGQADQAASELLGYFRHLVADPRAKPLSGLTDTLVTAHDANSGALSAEELLANLALILIAGFGTTRNLLGNGMAILLGHPEFGRGLREGTLPVDRFIDEVLRFDAPVQIVSRYPLRRDLIVAGLPVSLGGEAVLLIGAANRDPARFSDPDSFDPWRAGPRPLSFGAGSHYCLGATLARLEAAIAFPLLVERFPNLITVAEVPPVRGDSFLLRGYETLPVVAVSPGSGHRTRY